MLGTRRQHSSTIKFKRFCIKNMLDILLVFALVIGVALGILMRFLKEHYTAKELSYIRFPGEILLNLLKLLLLPLVMSSIISGLTLMDTWAVGKMALRTALYFMVTYMLACILGLFLAWVILPRKETISDDMKTSMQRSSVLFSVFDVMRQMWPENMVEMAFQRTVTVLKEKHVTKPPTHPALEKENATDTSKATDEVIEIPELKIVHEPNMMGVIVLSVAAGMIINHLGNRGLPLRIFFDAIYEVTIALINIVNWYTPIGVFFLVVQNIVAIKSGEDFFREMSFFMTVLAGLLIHCLMVLPVIYFYYCRRNPYKFLRRLLVVVVTAIGTSSSLATLPITMKSLGRHKHIVPRLVAFVAPIGASINMDGTAMFEVVAVIFIGYAEGDHLSFSKFIVAALMSIITAITISGVPQSGLVTLGFVLRSVGISPDLTSRIVSLDWLLDRFRTTTNVLSDCIGCAVIQAWYQEDLHRMDIENEEEDDSSTYSTSNSPEAPSRSLPPVIESS